jgi:hypothetical protein
MLSVRLGAMAHVTDGDLALRDRDLVNYPVVPNADPVVVI